MKKYNIFPNALIGAVFKSESSERQYYYPEGKFPKDSIVMIIDSYMEDKLISGIDFLVVTDGFKKELKQKSYTELSFEPIDFFFIDLNLLDNFPNHGFTKDSFWKLNIADHGEDFIEWKSQLIVSEKALNFLYQTNAFADFDEGIALGPEHSLITNKFLIEGDLDDFFLNVKPKLMVEIEQKRKQLKELRSQRRK